MKKMLLGVFLLLAVIAAVSINSHIIRSKLSETRNEIVESLLLPASIADNYLKESFRKWVENGKYLRLIMSESSLTTISECYFECMNMPESINLRNKLIYKLTQLIESESVSLQSIF